MPYTDATDTRLGNLLESFFNRILDGEVFQAMEDRNDEPRHGRAHHKRSFEGAGFLQ